MRRRAPVRMAHSDDLLDRQWQGLRACLLEGGAREDQLGAMRAAFFCGAHATIAMLARGRDAADAVMLELERDMRADQAIVRRMGMH